MQPDLRGANLCEANLCAASLRGADLRGNQTVRRPWTQPTCTEPTCVKANLDGAKNSELMIARLQFIPREEGSFIGWKKCREGVIVKLSIPGRMRSAAMWTERKCRASKAVVLEVIGAEFGISIYDGKTKYRKGETVVLGIHSMMTAGMSVLERD